MNAFQILDKDNKVTKDEITLVQTTVRSGHHTFSCNKILNEQHAKVLQMELGYHPNGYSFHSFKITLKGTTWKCYNSCD